MAEPLRVDMTIQPAPEVRLVDSLRASIAGNAAVGVAASALALFEAGGKRVLDASTRGALRAVAEKGASRALAAVASPILEAATASGGAGAASGRSVVSSLASPARHAAVPRSAALVSGAAGQAARVAASQVLRGAGRAAGIGFLLDGAVAGVEAVIAVRNGSTDQATAVRHVAKEATSGAIATGTGVLLAAGLVALTGGVGAPVVFAMGAIGSIGTKRLVRRWMG